MNSTTYISKITERGQITLPKHFRDTQLFKNAHAVQFTKQGDSIVLSPISVQFPPNEHLSLLDETMQDWSSPENDDLFDFK